MAGDDDKRDDLETLTVVEKTIFIHHKLLNINTIILARLFVYSNCLSASLQKVVYMSLV